MRFLRSRLKRTEAKALVGAQAPVRPPLAAEFDLAQLFRAAYERLHRHLVLHAQRFLDRDSALDAVAEAVAKVWANWPHLTPAQRSDRYFFRALSTCIVDQHRALKRRVSLDDADAELEQSALASFATSARGDAAAEVLDEALAAMPRRRREVLLLIHEENFTYGEAAECLGLSIGTINTHMRLALEDLRRAFARAGFQLDAPTAIRLPAPKGGTPND